MYSAYSTYIHKQHLKVKMNTVHMNIYLLMLGYKINSYTSSYPLSMLENPAFWRLLGGETEVREREKLMVALYTYIHSLMYIYIHTYYHVG